MRATMAFNGLTLEAKSSDDPIYCLFSIATKILTDWLAHVRNASISFPHSVSLYDEDDQQLKSFDISSKHVGSKNIENCSYFQDLTMN